MVSMAGLRWVVTLANRAWPCKECLWLTPLKSRSKNIGGVRFKRLVLQAASLPINNGSHTDKDRPRAQPRFVSQSGPIPPQRFKGNNLRLLVRLRLVRDQQISNSKRIHAISGKWTPVNPPSKTCTACRLPSLPHADSPTHSGGTSSPPTSLICLALCRLLVRNRLARIVAPNDQVKPFRPRRGLSVTVCARIVLISRDAIRQKVLPPCVAQSGRENDGFCVSCCSQGRARCFFCAAGSARAPFCGHTRPIQNTRIHLVFAPKRQWPICHSHEPGQSGG